MAHVLLYLQIFWSREEEENKVFLSLLSDFFVEKGEDERKDSIQSDVDWKMSQARLDERSIEGIFGQFFDRIGPDVS